MIVTCERCAARYKLDDAKIKGRGARITCPKCQHVFVVLAKGEESPRPEPAAAPAAAPLPAAAPAAAPAPATDPTPEAAGGTAVVTASRRADQLDFRKVGIATWKVRVRIGLVYDFSDTGTLRKYIQDRRVTDDDVISHDGTNWVRIGDIPDLDQYFVQVYEELEDARGAAEDDSDEEAYGDGPTMVVGMGSLRSNISTGVFARPGAPAENAPSGQRPGTPVADAPGGPGRFADPFESLKARQRERLRSRRRGEGPSGSQGRKGGAAPSADAPRGRRGLWVGAVVTAGVICGGWYLYDRRQSVVPTTPIEVPAARAAGPTMDADALRERLLRQLDTKLKPADDKEAEAPAEPADEGWKPVIPSDAAVRVPIPGVGPQIPGGSGASTANPPTMAPSTAADFVAAARTAASQGRWSEAVRGYRDALGKDPRNASIKLDYGIALYRNHDLETARIELEAVAAAGNCPGRVWLARVLRDLGDESGASGAYSNYLECNPGDQDAKRELQQLTGG